MKSEKDSTKAKIIDLLKEKPKTLTQLSSILRLAPSTISQHLKELEAAGAIRKSDVSLSKKWKYYEITPEFYDKMVTNKGVDISLILKRAVPAISVVAILSFLIAYFSGSYFSLPILFSDPPILPLGSKALLLNITGITLAVLYNGKTHLVFVPINKTVDVLNLTNSSEVMGSIRIRKGALITKAILDIKDGKLKIWNQTYTVIVPNNAEVNFSYKINSSTGGILIDLSPTVAQIYYTNSSTFILIPHLSVACLGNSQIARWKHGEVALIAVRKSENMLRVVNASGYSNGTDSNIQIKVYNSGNESLVIDHLFVFGEFGLERSISLPLQVSSSQIMPSPGSAQPQVVMFESSVNFFVNPNCSAYIPEFIGMEVHPEYFPVGCTIGPHQYGNITFSGPIRIAFFNSLGGSNPLEKYGMPVDGEYIYLVMANGSEYYFEVDCYEGYCGSGSFLSKG
ncbi:MAG: winged helix-turn-helix domain-containing protein [Candidatus Micrarchaeaceae archaeon]